MSIVEINSKDNEKIKALRKLKLKKYREQLGQFKTENLKTINEAIKAGIMPEQVYVTHVFLEKHQTEFEKLKIQEYIVITNVIYQSFSELEAPLGICAVFSKPESKIKFDSSIIYLNAINDPGNLGTILRSAVAFGYKNIIVDENCADIYNHKTVQASKSAIFKLNIEQDKELKLFDQIKSKKFKIIASVLDEKASDLVEVELDKDHCLVFGSESHGIDKKIQKQADEIVKIKIDSQMESLNVASAAAIVMNHFYN